MKRLLGGTALLALCAGTASAFPEPDLHRCSWDQWGGGLRHDGQMCSVGQPAKRKLAEVTIDPFVDQEMAETFGVLLAHYQVPLNDAQGNVFVESKGGSYMSCDPPGSFSPFPCFIFGQNGQIWREKGYRWKGDKLVEKWTFDSDWIPTPGWPYEPIFQPALSGPFIYIPGRDGTVWQVLKLLGLPIQRINPFDTMDESNFVSGGITADDLGNIYYTVSHQDIENNIFSAYLVKATPWGSTKKVSYDDLVPNGPKPDDLCAGQFSFEANPPALPWPPPNQPDGSLTLPDPIQCGTQLATPNMSVAIGPDGTLFTASENFALESWVIAVNPDLSPRWATSLDGLVNDGCGVLIPYGTGDSDCRPGATPGYDPYTNSPPHLFVDSRSSAAPTALPDGGVLFGATDNYPQFRGHTIKLDRHGKLAGSFDFGWDITPAVYQHDGTYSIVMKDNHYVTDGPYFITQLDANMKIEWQFQGVNEWCINAPAIDRDGTVYLTSEDGSFYSIRQGGILRDKLFLNIAEGAAYTPLSLDAKGRIYAMNNGLLTVLGR